MCISPIKIRVKNSSSYSYTDNSGRLVLHRASPYRYLHVPCGKCFECLRRKVNSLIFRSSTEFVASNKRGLFLTMTYDNRHLPLHPYLPSPGSLPLMIPVWDKTSVQKFFKSLNEKILYCIGTSRGLQRIRNGVISPEWKAFIKNEPRPLSYLCVCERGSSDVYLSDNGTYRSGTSRPHYHAALFLRTPDFDLESLKSLVLKTWSFGSVYPLVIGSSTRKHRDELGSIRYICKYMNSSDLSSFDHPLAKMSDLIFFNDSDRRNSLPFTLMSKFYGIDYLKKFDSVPSKEEICSLSVSIPSSCGSYSISLPRYYKDKLIKYTVRRQSLPSRYVSKKGSFGNPFTDSVPSTKYSISLRKPSQYIMETTSLGNSVRYYSRYLLAKNSYYNCLSFFLSSSCSSSSDSVSFNIFRDYVLRTDLRHFVKSYIYGLSVSDGSPAYAASSFVNASLSSSRLNHENNRLLVYKSHLSSAIKQSPELFNVSPL